MHALFPSGDEDQFSSDEGEGGMREEKPFAFFISCEKAHAGERCGEKEESVCAALEISKIVFHPASKSHFIFFHPRVRYWSSGKRTKKKKGSAREACDGVHEYFNIHTPRQRAHQRRVLRDAGDYRAWPKTRRMQIFRFSKFFGSICYFVWNCKFHCFKIRGI